MVQHIEQCHHVSLPKPQLQAIANKLIQAPKQAWACGVCGQHFTEYPSRLNHIRRDHIDAGQSRDDWYTSRVIWGLLHQPELVHVWKVRLAFFGAEDEMTTEMACSPSDLETLEKDLEVGPNPHVSVVDLVDRAVSMMPWGLGIVQR